MKTQVNKSQLNYILIYYILRANPIISLISFMGIFIFFLCLDYVFVNQQYGFLSLAVFFIHPIKWLVKTLILRKRLIKRDLETLVIENPHAEFKKAESKNGEVLLGVEISGTIDGEKVRVVEFDSKVTKKRAERRVAEINGQVSFKVEVARKTNVVANCYNLEEQIKVVKLHEDSYCESLLDDKVKKLKYPPVLYSLEDIKSFLVDTSFIEDLFLLNCQQKYLKLQVLPEVDGMKRVFMVFDNQYFDIDEVINYLKDNGFVDSLDMVSIFEITEGNSPLYLKRSLDD